MFEYPPGATPLDPDEADGLIPFHITTQNQLNEWEQNNILEAEKWVNQQTFKLSEIITSDFIKMLHKKMFNKTWSWSGEFRQSNKNIGTDWLSISVVLKILLDDIYFQLENQVYNMDELVTRFHHRLVAIHPFSNGNGRHARLMSDILLLSRGEKRFSWGQKQLVQPSLVRKSYIDALRAADKGDYQFLLSFVRS